MNILRNNFEFMRIQYKHFLHINLFFLIQKKLR